MKKTKLCILSLLAIIVFCVTGCESGTYYPTEQESTLSPTPTAKELVETIGVNKSSIDSIKSSLKTAVAGISNVELSDVKKMINAVVNTYGGLTYYDDSSDTTYKFDNISQMAILSSYSSSSDEAEPILIIDDVQLVDNTGKSQVVTLVLLGGTEIKKDQTTGIITDILTGMGLENNYLYNAYYAIRDHYTNSNGEVDYSHKLVIQGISLGGMVAQQLAGLYAEYERQGVQNFDVLYVTPYASPLVMPEMIQDTAIVRRMVDSMDVVPKLSVYFKEEYKKEGMDTVYANNTYLYNENSCSKSFIGSHVACYIDSNEWAGVDVLGFQNGGSTVTFKRSDMHWYPTPVVKDTGLR